MSSVKVQLSVVPAAASEGSKTGDGVGEGPRVAVKLTVVNKRKRDRSGPAPLKDNGVIKVGPAGAEQAMTIPLFWDDQPALPTYGNLSIEDHLLQSETMDEAFFDKLRVVLKKKRRKIDPPPTPAALRGKFSASRDDGARKPSSKPKADLNDPAIQAFIAENMKSAEQEMIRRAYKRILRSEVSKHHRIVNIYFRKQQNELKKMADACARETKNRFFRVHRESLRSHQRMRRVTREMTFYWKKQNKGTAREKKQADREAAEQRRREEEKREEKRKQQQLNFLLTQTELYAHFMAKKIGADQENPLEAQQANLKGLSEADREEEQAMHEKAAKIANRYVSQTELATQTFDHESERLRLEATGSMQNPSTMPTFSDVQQPRGIQGDLKGYQLKGLQWLANIYDQGLNGILADEMGLGKTVQAISFMAYLAEVKGIWGPFLVVAPGSTLHNWDREIQSFFPQFKVLPYWGNKAQRKDVRPCIHPKKLYSENAHHIVVTSYDIILKDELQLKRVKWQFMILDEAQAIKNADSFRWKILLSFSCRNRLLLTGTPIQNNMAELWALLHFIMPTLFDSHDEFNEWFSKGIESHAVGQQSLNEHQLKRLHTVLQPFMLRRIKKDVENEMAPKEEVMVPCHLTLRQKELYRRVKDKVSIVDLFEGKSMNEGKVQSLMNIVMQLRKVCNHPELFEQQKEVIPFHFAELNLPLEPAPWGELDWAWCRGRRSPISFHLPKLIYDEGMGCLPSCFAGHLEGPRHKLLTFGMGVLEPSNVRRSLSESQGHAGGLAFLSMIGLCPSEIFLLSRLDAFQRWYFSRRGEKKWNRIASFYEGCPADSRSGPVFLKCMLRLRPKLSKSLYGKDAFAALDAHDSSLVCKGDERILRDAGLVRAVGKHIDRVRAVRCEVRCARAGFASQQKRYLQSDWEHEVLFGFGNHQVKFWDRDDFQCRSQSLVPYAKPLLSATAKVTGSGLSVKFYALAKALADGGKLQVLDTLLRDLKAKGHRVLLFSQMTNMMNILEDYMVFRKIKFLRLDGSTKLEDRRDMVDAYMEDESYFMFLLSTRAGGLGINLTAADTVIFYESDWNPTMDQQAMDRCHRIGQQKPVTVYRLVTRDTIEEKILKRAEQKSKVQRLVMKSGIDTSSKDEKLDNEEIKELLS